MTLEADVTRTLPAIAILAIGALLAVTGCGGGSDSSGEGAAYGSGTEEAGSAQSAKSETGAGKEEPSVDGVITVGSNPELGAILVNDLGLTLYDFHKDKGGKSACYGACAATWPPMITSAAGQISGVSGKQAAKLGKTTRKDGTLQVTYAGHPLYTYADDKEPGEANGQNIDSFGGEWYTLQPSGEEAGS
jgi:predicted lipoprotein with Yx(FWY)xxD motif